MAKGLLLLAKLRECENIRDKVPQILDILLLDRSMSSKDKPRNIIWANDNYTVHDPVAYDPKAEITPELIVGDRSSLIVPRARKTVDLQKERTKTRAEVFTPTWIVKKQNDAVDAEYADDNLETYVQRKWLEITCGEAPYMASRYDMESGEIIPLADRVGFVDRKLARISAEVNDRAEWQRLAVLAYKASYGFEWNGDSLLIARENLLYTYMEYFSDKWGESAEIEWLKEVAEIISYNVFQMDGLTYTIPLSENTERIPTGPQQLSLDFGTPDEGDQDFILRDKVKIMDWSSPEPEMIYFEKIATQEPGTTGLQLGTTSPKPGTTELQLGTTSPKPGKPSVRPELELGVPRELTHTNPEPQLGNPGSTELQLGTTSPKPGKPSVRPELELGVPRELTHTNSELELGRKVEESL